jgi:hypothetical protein
MSDPKGQESEGGLGQDGTIPDSETGIAAGYTPGGSTFEPEEDVAVEEGGAADADADADAGITSRDPEAGGGPSLDDL